MSINKPNMYKFVPVGHKMALHNCGLDLVNWNCQSTLPAITDFLLQKKIFFLLENIKKVKLHISYRAMDKISLPRAYLPSQ